MLDVMVKKTVIEGFVGWFCKSLIYRISRLTSETRVKLGGCSGQRPQN